MKIVFATHNKHKIAEVQQMLPPEVELVSLADLGCEEIPETGKTFEENALIKARFVKEHFGLDAFSDDSGLEVEALNGAPGVYSARYASPEKNDHENMALLLRNLERQSNRKARFRAVIALVFQGKEYLFEGQVVGKIAYQRQGYQGHGYDPIFVPKGYDQTFAQMSTEEKNTISHRAEAVAKLLQFFKKYLAQ